MIKLLALILLIAFVLFIVWAVDKAWAIWSNRPGKTWSVTEVTSRGQTQLYLTKRGQPREPFGEPISERLSAFEYEEELFARRAAAQERVDVKNRPLASS